MSVEAIAVVLHHSKAKGTDKLVLIGIANHEGDGGAWPSVETLAKYGDVDERTVRRSLRRLEKLGEITTHVQAGGPSGIPAWRRPNRYAIHVDCPPTCDRTRWHRTKSLPQAPGDLWTTGGTPTSPPDAHVPTPLTPTSPPPLTPTSPETSIETNHEAGSSPEVTTDRAGERCSVCFRTEPDCVRAIATSGHTFTPRRQR